MHQFNIYKILSLVFAIILSVTSVRGIVTVNTNSNEIQETVLETTAIVTEEAKTEVMAKDYSIQNTQYLVLSNRITPKPDIVNMINTNTFPIMENSTTITAEEVVEEEVLELTIEPEEQKVIDNVGPQEVKIHSEQEIYELAKIVYCEAGGESQLCKEYVAQVVINRVNSERFPNTIHDVIFQGRQFSPTFDGSWERKEPDESCYNAALKVINSTEQITTALYFEACRGESWHSRNLTEVAAIDNTRFYN